MFKFLNEEVTIQTGHPKRFEVSFDGKKKKGVADLNDAIQFIAGNVTEEDEEE